MEYLLALDASWPTLDTSWLALAAYAVMLAIVLVICDGDHFVPKWSLRLFLAALAMQSTGGVLAFPILLAAAQWVSTAGIAWIVFAMIQDIKMQGGKHGA